MIARIWRGATTAAHAAAYLDYLRRTSVTETPAIPATAACKSSGASMATTPNS